MTELSGMKAISQYVNRSGATILKWIEEWEFPAKKINGIWKSDTLLIEEWNSKQSMGSKIYSVKEVADILKVDKRTIMKWLEKDENGEAIIPPEAWFKLPRQAGIRIREWAVQILMEQ